MLQVLYSYIASGFLLDYLFDVVAAGATMTKTIAIRKKFEGFFEGYILYCQQLY
jgi:hypothetical protein